MRILSTSLLAVFTVVSHLQPALGEPFSQVPIRTHPSQGDVTHVTDASAKLWAGDDGVFVNMTTSGLENGDVYTLLMAVINKPGQCPVLPCTPKDVLARSEAVLSDVAYAGGVTVSEDGTAHFTHHQSVGLFRPGFFDNGLIGTQGVEIHLIVNDHGPAIKGREYEMLTTYRGGCSDKSLPPPMPNTARSQGQSGPNTCRMVQFAQFIPEDPAS